MQKFEDAISSGKDLKMAVTVKTSGGIRRIITHEEFLVITAVRERREEEKYPGGRCRYCGTEAQLAFVSYFYWGRIFPLGGKGKHKRVRERVKYCPKCEGIPSSQGSLVVKRSYG